MFLNNLKYLFLFVFLLIGKGGKNFGIQSKCDLELLSSFKVTDNYVVDIMHDLLSGVFIYEILKKGISENLFKLDDFNTAKNEFDFGSKEKHSKMEDVKLTSKGEISIHCHAREMWSLMKFLPFILGKLLRQDNRLYKFALIISDLLDLTFKSSFLEEDLKTLQNVIEVHNKEFLKLFRPHTLPPKFHHMTHYVRVIKESGPLKNLWSMRFESKHQSIKAQAKVMHSRRNICFTFSKKICFQNAYNDLQPIEIVRNIKKITRQRENFLPNFINDLSSFQNCSKIVFCGRNYSVGDFIFSSCKTFTYKIKQIAIDELKDSVKLIVDRYSLKYVSNLRYYKIDSPIKICECLDIDYFITPPLNQHFHDGSYYLRFEEF